ncbi:MAG TPA: TonB-dependent receptor plug domain-containing protein, partial [Vicinamibacteria bacterium]|nr:TonB-dependent receptor plug domain-containing protein [Vicinamibacteria bacterium]
MRSTLAWAAALLCQSVGTGAFAAPAGTAEPAAPPRDLTELSLSDLVQVKVTSVSKEPVERQRTAAAVTVITQDDIRRSGATTLAEVLRLAPGVAVARIDSTHWSIGVRGFGDQFSKSVLVLIDGRNVYTPLFAGVFWGLQDTVLADIDHIEVIRGPGGRIWGANAVNGVINIITKKARDTHGTLAALTGGTVDHGIGEVRYGGGNGRNVDYRVYGKGTDRGDQSHSDGQDFDTLRMGQAGGRVDWTLGPRDSLTVQADGYGGRLGQSVSLASYAPPSETTFYDPLHVSGGNAVARWQRELAAGSDLQVQAYYDHTHL